MSESQLKKLHDAARKIREALYEVESVINEIRIQDWRKNEKPDHLSLD